MSIPLSAREQALKTISELVAYPNYFSDAQLWLTIFVGWAMTWPFVFYIRGLGVLQKKPLTPRTNRFLDHFVGVSLLVCFAFNVYYKVSMGWAYLAYLLYPCHSLSLAWPYVVWSKNYRRAEFMWNILIFYTAFPMLALMFPDTSDVVFPLQTEIYWIHHVLLVLTPAILFFTKKYHIERVSYHWYAVASLIGFWFCYGVQLLVATVLRLNINYLLWPPPGHEEGSHLSGPLYHVKMTLILMAGAWISGYPFFWLVQWIEGRMAPSASSHTVSSPSQRRKKAA